MFLLGGMAVCSKIRVYFEGFNTLKFVAAAVALVELVYKFQRLLVSSLQQHHPLIHPALLSQALSFNLENTVAPACSLLTPG